jgi:hypothetical protein
MRAITKNGWQHVTLALPVKDAAILSALAREHEFDLNQFCGYLLTLIAGRYGDFRQAAALALGTGTDVPADLAAGIELLRSLVRNMESLGWLVGYQNLRDEELLTRVEQLETLHQVHLEEAISRESKGAPA